MNLLPMPEQWVDILVFGAKAAGISLSGVMAPGVITAATLAAGTRNRHAGALVAVGHGIVELPLMVLIMLGMGAIFAIEGVTIGIGLAGGLLLLYMATGMFRGLRSPAPATVAPVKRGPVMIGILLTAGNPFFLLWWATIGLTLSIEAGELGALAFALFALIHWSCDLIWLEILTLAAFKGTQRFGQHSQKVILIVCATALTGFGIRFLWVACSSLITS
jgi:threonine/homoserine/homoserine lactone efflux protein